MRDFRHRAHVPSPHQWVMEHEICPVVVVVMALLLPGPMFLADPVSCLRALAGATGANIDTPVRGERGDIGAPVPSERWWRRE